MRANTLSVSDAPCAPRVQAAALSHIYEKAMVPPHAPRVLRRRCKCQICVSRWTGAAAALRRPGVYDDEFGPLVHFTLLRMCFKHSEDCTGVYYELPASEEMLDWLRDHEFHGACGFRRSSRAAASTAGPLGAARRGF